MKNILKIDDYSATIDFDPETNEFRGEFIGLNGGADFYASSAVGLKKEGKKSLEAFLQVCKEEGIEPRKPYSGKFLLRLDPSEHEAVAKLAAASGKSLNQWAAEVLVSAIGDDSYDYTSSAVGKRVSTKRNAA